LSYDDHPGDSGILLTPPAAGLALRLPPEKEAVVETTVSCGKRAASGKRYSTVAPTSK